MLNKITTQKKFSNGGVDLVVSVQIKISEWKN